MTSTGAGRARHRLSAAEVKMLKVHRDRPNILVVGDTHFPFVLPGYLDFVLDISDRYACGTTVHIGDLVDAHAVSTHTHDPDGLSAGDEFSEAEAEIRRWEKAFPTLTITMGNHDMRPYKRATDIGLPDRFLLGFKDAFGVQANWQFVEEIEINDVIFRHKGGGGRTPAANYAQRNGVSAVTGHIHTAGGVQYVHQRKRQLWGLDSGCGIDRASYAMAYAADCPESLALGCGVLIDGGKLPIFVPMTESYK